MPAAHGAVVVGCDGVSLTESAGIDSWNSRDGLYTPALAGANTLVATVAPDADLSVGSEEVVRADVLAARDLLVSGGAEITGNYFAGRDIIFSGDPACPIGSVQAGGSVAVPGSWWQELCAPSLGSSGWKTEVRVMLPDGACDPLGVTSSVAGMIAEHSPAGAVAPWPHTGWREAPVHIDADTAYSGFTIGAGAHPVTVDASSVDHLFIDGDFVLTSSAELHIQNPLGPAQPRELQIIVTGDVETSGSSLLTVDAGISVRLYTTGTVSISGGAAQDITPSIEIDGRVEPTFGVYSSYSGGAGVNVNNHAPLTAVVYAPHTEVSVGGSGEVFGAVRGRTVSVSGSGWIHYDENIDANSNWDGGPIFVTDLAVALGADATEAAFNEDVALEVTVAGGGGGHFEGVVVDVTLPPELDYVSHRAPAGTEFVDSNGDGIPDRWRIPEVRAQETHVLEILTRGLNIPDPAAAWVEASLSEWSGSRDAYPDNNEAALAVDILASPLLTVTKLGSDEASRPGEVIDFTTALTNVAQATAHDVYVRGRVGAHLALSLDAFGDGVPFRFTEGEPPSGLSLGEAEFSNDGGLTWSYDLVSGAGGAPSGFDAQVTHWRIPMAGPMQPRSSFRIEYQAVIR